MNGLFAKLKNRMHDAAGAGIALVALSMVALLSAVALAVDVGMLVTARTEAQVVGDATALEGARVLRDSNGDSALAHNEAVAFGSVTNTVRGEFVPILEEDVEVLPDEWTVRVRVNRTGVRGNAVPTFFARIFGVSEVDITAKAAAWAAPAITAGGNPNDACLLPLAMLNEWDDTNGNGVYDEGEPLLSYDEGDHGKLIKLKLQPSTTENHGGGPPEGAGCPGTTDSNNPEVEYNFDYCESGGGSAAWRCWWRDEEGADGGVEALAPLIYPATDCGPEMSVNDTVWGASAVGNKQSLVNGAFADLINADLNKEWCPDCAAGGSGCVVETGSLSCYEGQSIRMRSAPVVNPVVAGEGAGTYSTIDNFIGVFVEQVSCSYAAGQFGGPDGRWNVYVRLMVEGGTGSTGGGGESEESLLRNLQLIE